MRIATLAIVIPVIFSSTRASAQQCSPSPDLLVVFDKSGSMAEAAGNETKWSAAKKAITTLATSYETALRLGLALFPYGGGDCATGQVVAPIPASAATILAKLGGTGPLGGTPTTVSLQAAKSYLDGLSDGRKKYVLLITDGMPNCIASCPTCLDSANAVGAVTALRGAGYLTYVVGFGSGVDPTTLNDMASAGGTARAGATRYYSASDQATLTTALDAIATNLNVKKPCAGPCGNGEQLCLNDGSWGACSAPALGATEQCATTGTCGSGTRSCTATGWTQCVGSVTGSTRPCKGECGPGEETCGPDGWSGCTASVGGSRACSSSCGSGKQRCTPGGWSICELSGLTNACGTCGEAPAEICDGKDNDCDGLTDEGATCPGGAKCQGGACRKPCGTGELSGKCAAGETCRSGTCTPDDCASVTCPVNQLCRGGACVDPCAGVACASDRICKGGACLEISCYTMGCPGGQRCTQGACKADPCAGKTCPSDQYCREGACVKSCAGIACAAGEECRDGACRETGCGASCASPRICEGGSCSGDPCAGVFCAANRICVGGGCVDDPCRSISCPSAGEICKLGQCYLPTDAALQPPAAQTQEAPAGAAPTEASPAGPGRARTAETTVAGSCGCSPTGGTAAGAFPMILLAGLAAMSLARRAARRD